MALPVELPLSLQHRSTTRLPPGFHAVLMRATNLMYLQVDEHEHPPVASISIARLHGIDVQGQPYWRAQLENLTGAPSVQP